MAGNQPALLNKTPKQGKISNKTGSKADQWPSERQSASGRGPHGNRFGTPDKAKKPRPDVPGLVPTDVFGKHSLDDAGQQENDRLARSMARVGQHDGILGDIEGALRHDGGKAVFEVSDLADRFTHHAGRQQKDRPPQFEREVEAIAGKIDQEQGTDLAKQWRAQRRRVTPAIHEPDGRRRQPTATMPEAASGERKRHLNPYAPTHDLLGNRLPPVYFPLPGEPGSLDDALDARAKWRQDRRKTAEKEAAKMASESASRAARPDALTQQIPKGHPGIPGVTEPMSSERVPPTGADEEMPEWFKKWLQQRGQEAPQPPQSPGRPDDADFPEIIVDGPLVHWPDATKTHRAAATARAADNSTSIWGEANKGGAGRKPDPAPPTGGGASTSGIGDHPGGTTIWGEPSKGDAGRKPTRAPPSGGPRPGKGEGGHPGVGMDTSQRPEGDPGEGGHPGVGMGAIDSNNGETNKPTSSTSREDLEAWGINPDIPGATDPAIGPLLEEMEGIRNMTLEERNVFERKLGNLSKQRPDLVSVVGAIKIKAQTALDREFMTPRAMTNDELNAHLEASENIANASSVVAATISSANRIAKKLKIPMPQALRIAIRSSSVAAGTASKHYSTRAQAYIVEIARRRLKQKK